MIENNSLPKPNLPKPSIDIDGKPKPKNNNEKITFLAMDGCPHCASAKEKLNGRIVKGEIDMYNVHHDQKAVDLAKKYRLNAFPTFLVGDAESGKADVCHLARDGKKLYCENDKEVEL